MARRTQAEALRAYEAEHDVEPPSGGQVNWSANLAECRRRLAVYRAARAVQIEKIWTVEDATPHRQALAQLDNAIRRLVTEETRILRRQARGEG